MKTLVLAFAVIATVGASTGCSDSENPTANGPASAGVPASVSAQAPQRNPAAAPPSAAPTKLPTRDDANVDARDFQIGDEFYFQSPSKNIKCGFIEANGLGTGCQLSKATVIPTELPDCGTRPDRAVAAQVVGGQAKFLCTSQGIFVGIPQNTGGSGEGGGKVLEYGQTIVVRGTACTSTEAGIQCSQAGHGFFIAADKQYLF